MNSRTKLIQINEYILLEFEYNSNKYKIEDTGSLLIQNNKVG
jgi:hypothetical protein